jgi:phosphatidylserine/phosphatidylglycerophosphate/cardiolipin synthase-like enzyme
MTDVLDLGAITHPDGFFLVAGSSGPRPGFQPTNIDTGVDYRHIFTRKGSGTTIKETALELIGSARQKVFVASYLLGEPDLLTALFDVARRLRGGVYVISELSERTMRQQLAELEEEADADAAVRAHKKNFAELTRHGVAVRGRADCHAKFLIVDDRAALVSSANLDTRGLNETGENGVLVTDPAEVDRVARFFTRLWDSCSYDMPAGSAEYSVRERPPSPSRCRVPVPDVTPAPGVIWTDGKEERLILAHLHDIIGRARRRLMLATFSLNGLVSHRELLIEPLTAALRDGEVAASLLCRGRNNMTAHRRDAAALADLGVRIYADQLNHAKGVIADDAHGALFSANFDAAHGLLDGVEVGMRLDGQPALAEASRFFRHAMEHADLEYARHPTAAQLNAGLAARWHVPWSYGKRLSVTTTAPHWQRFRADAATGPVLYALDKTAAGKSRAEIRLYAGAGQWLLSPPRADGTRDLTPRDAVGQQTSQDAVGLLEQWLTAPRRGRTERANSQACGFCPAVMERG